MSNLPLYTVIPRAEFNAIRANVQHRKGAKRVIISTLDLKVGLLIGDVCYAQQFGSIDQAVSKYKEIKETF